MLWRDLLSGEDLSGHEIGVYRGFFPEFAISANQRVGRAVVAKFGFGFIGEFRDWGLIGCR
jgi:hypothetical protein